MKNLLLAATLSLVPMLTLAGQVQIVDARARPDGDGSYRFDVTLRHADSGWDHYADKWEVIGTDGRILGQRVLLHPHVSEQPFTRSLGGVRIPATIRQVQIRAHDNVHGYADREYPVELSR